MLYFSISLKFHIVIWKLIIFWCKKLDHTRMVFILVCCEVCNLNASKKLGYSPKYERKLLRISHYKYLSPSDGMNWSGFIEKFPKKLLCFILISSLLENVCSQVEWSWVSLGRHVCVSSIENCRIYWLSLCLTYAEHG